MRRDLRALQRTLNKQLEPLVTEGVNVDKAQAILADYTKKRTQLLTRSKSEVEKAMSAQGDSRAHGLASRRRALEVLATPGLPFAPTSQVLKPFLTG
jgi:hypothetical protein